MTINNKPLKKVNRANDRSEKSLATSAALTNVDGQMQDVVTANNNSKEITYSKEEAVFNLDELLLLLDELWPLEEPRTKKFKTK